MELQTFFSKNNIFTIEEVKKHYKITNRNHTLKNLLSYHVKKGNLIRIRRALYYTIPKGSDRDQYPVDPFLVASKLVDSAVIGYHTALAYHGKLNPLRNDNI